MNVLKGIDAVEQVKKSEYSPYIVWLLWMWYCQLYYLWGKFKILKPLCHITVPWLSSHWGKQRCHSQCFGGTCCTKQHGWGTQVLEALLTTWHIQHCVKDALTLVFSSLVWDCGKGYAEFENKHIFTIAIWRCVVYFLTVVDGVCRHGKVILKRSGLSKVDDLELQSSYSL